VRGLRIGIQQLILKPIVGLVYRRRVTGLEHLRGLKGPVMFTPNHHLHNDNAIILCSIPLGWRRRLSVAAALDGIFRSRFRGFWAAVIGNAFPLAREGAVRRSLDLLGARLDRGYSILIYPEGKLTVGGPLQEFKSGTGLVAIHGAIPVVPMRLKIHSYSRFDKDAPEPSNSWRGDVEVVFGKPIRFAVDDDPNRATAEIRAAVEAL
jgi:long-chain acyl-CoA synthetase